MKYKEEMCNSIVFSLTVHPKGALECRSLAAAFERRICNLHRCLFFQRSLEAIDPTFVY